MIEPGSPTYNVLARIADMMEKANVSVTADIDLLVNRAADPRPGMKLLISQLRNLSGEANYQAERLEELLSQL
jgi:hypothetical protein